MGNAELSSKIKTQEAWENEPQNVKLTLDYLDELCAAGDVSSSEMVLKEAWDKQKNNEIFLGRLLSESTYVLLLPYVQYLDWQDDPKDIEGGLDVVQGLLIKKQQEEAEKVIDMLFDAVDSPIKFLKMVREDSRLDSLSVLCEQRAIQYQARNSLKKKMAKRQKEKAEEEKPIEIGDGYEVINGKVCFEGKECIDSISPDKVIALKKDDSYGYVFTGEEIYCKGRRMAEINKLGYFKIIGGGYSYVVQDDGMGNLHFDSLLVGEFDYAKDVQECEFFENKKYVKIGIIIYENGVPTDNYKRPQKSTKPKKKKEKETPVELGGGYKSFEGKIHFQEIEIKEAAVETFESLYRSEEDELSQGYAKDKQNVYLRGEKILGVKPEKFEILGGGYSTDNKWLFFDGKKTVILFNVAKQSLMHVDEDGVVKIDDRVVLKNGEIQPVELADGYEARKDMYVFYKGKEILGAVSEDFKVLGNGYATDNEWLYFEGVRTKIPFNFRKQIFSVLQEEGSGVVDDEMIIENGKIKLTELGGGYLKGDGTLYFGETQIKGADMKSFEVIKEKHAMDKKKMFYTHEELEAAVKRGEKIDFEDLAKTLIGQGKAKEVFRPEFKKKIGKDIFDLILKNKEKDILYKNVEKLEGWFVFEDIACPLNRLFQEGVLKQKKVIINIVGRIKDCKINKENFNLLLSGEADAQDFLYTNIEHLSGWFECQNENELIDTLLKNGNEGQKKLVLSKLDKIKNCRITEKQYIEFVRMGGEIKKLIPLLSEITSRIISSVNKDKELSRLILENIEKMKGVNEALFLNTLNNANLDKSPAPWGLKGHCGHYHIETGISLKILSNLSCIEGIKGNIFKSKYFDLLSMSESSARNIFPELFRKIKKEDYQKMKKWLTDILKKNSEEVDAFRNLERQEGDHNQALRSVKRPPFAYLWESTESFYSNPYTELLKGKVVPQEMHTITKQEVEKFLNDWK